MGTGPHLKEEGAIDFILLRPENTRQILGHPDNSPVHSEIKKMVKYRVRKRAMCERNGN